MPEQAHDPTSLAVARVWDTAYVALKAREVAATVVGAGGTAEQIEDATDSMASALNDLCDAVRHLDAVAGNRPPSAEVLGPPTLRVLPPS